MQLSIKLYGADRCHKTQYYIKFLKTLNLDFSFYDVEKNEIYASELRSLYSNRNLNFPTLVIGSKKLRNPTDKELLKWINKQTSSNEKSNSIR